MSVPPPGPPDDAAPSSGAGWPPPGWPGREHGRRAAEVGPVPSGWPPAGWPGAVDRRGAGSAPAPTWEPGRFRWADLVVVLAYIALMIVGLGYALAALLGLVPASLDAFDVMDGFTVNLLSYAILVVLVLVVAWRPLVESLRVFATGTWWKLLLLPGLWLACIVVNVVVLSLLQEAPTSANQAALEEMASQAPFLPMALMTVVGAPLVEEYLFRHLLVGKLSRHINVWVCAAVSVAAFTLLHFLGTGFRFDPVELIPYLTLAVALTVSYVLLGRSLAFSVSLHMVNNGIALAMLYLVAPLLPEVPTQPVTPTVILPALHALPGLDALPGLLALAA